MAALLDEAGDELLDELGEEILDELGEPEDPPQLRGVTRSGLRAG